MASSDENEDDLSLPMSDEELLKTVATSQFQDLCRQLRLATTGTKEEMLLRLRQHANEQAALEAKRREELKARIEEGANADERERHEIVGSEDYFQMDEEEDNEEEETDDEGYFYFQLPTDPNEEMKEKEANAKTQEKSGTAPKRRPYMTQSDVLAPPPPPPSEATIDEDGNTVVQVYSTTDHNDLTGIAAAQPGQAALAATEPMVAGTGSNGPQPWDMEPEKTTKSPTPKELESAKEKITELVQMLLAMSGAPAFRHFDMPEELEDINDEASAYGVGTDYSTHPEKGRVVGFDPTQVPSHLLEEASQALRADRGQVLKDVLREFEIHAVGQDGMAGDNVEDGGGHFKEVSKVRAFLEGYRRAEVRKASRRTASLLLDKLVSEGVEGLDVTLASMSRSSDDSTNAHNEFELNDSLINYLNDIIREQEKKVDRLGAKTIHKREEEEAIRPTEDDPIESLWNNTIGEGGETIASIDPSDPKVKNILRKEMEKEDRAKTANGMQRTIPETTPEKLLLLLTLLRERIKTEAAFAGDERSRNLRLLAYCLQCRLEDDREQLIKNSLGTSVDRFDSFLELVASSIEYAESTSHKLTPSKRMPLNVPLLRSIHDLAEGMRDKHTWKSSGLRP